MKLYEINCQCCGNTLGVQFMDANSPQNWVDAEPTYCYLCAHSICDLVQELGIWGGNPNKHELYRLVKHSDLDVQMRWNFIRQFEKLGDNR